MVYFCYSSSLNVCVAYIFLFWIAIWPLCGKVTVHLAFCKRCFHKGPVISCLCFFPFDVSDGRCGIIVSIPDHCLPFYFALKFKLLLLNKQRKKNSNFSQ